MTCHLFCTEGEDVDLFEHVLEFQEAASIEHAPGIQWDLGVLAYRGSLLEEETKETAKGFGMEAPDWLVLSAFGWTQKQEAVPLQRESIDHVKIADGLVDTVYVALGALLQLYGEDCARELWDVVHKANMAKLIDGKLVKRADGKVLKPEDWTPPDIEGVLRKHGVLP